MCTQKCTACSVALQLLLGRYQYPEMELLVSSMSYFFLRVDEAAILSAQAHIANRHSIVSDEVSDPRVLDL